MPENAAIYIADPSLIGTKLLGKLEGIVTYETVSQDGNVTGLVIDLSEGQITISFMPDDQFDGHLLELTGYVEQQIRDTDKRAYALSRLRYVRLVLNCVIDPGFDEVDNTIWNFVTQLNADLNGLFFYADSLYDYDGEPLVGPAIDKDAQAATS